MPGRPDAEPWRRIQLSIRDIRRRGCFGQSGKFLSFPRKSWLLDHSKAALRSIVTIQRIGWRGVRDAKSAERRSNGLLRRLSGIPATIFYASLHNYYASW